MIACVNKCAFCRAPIESGQRWVREKIYDPTLNGCDASYHRYHAEPFAEQQQSCWEKHQMELEYARRMASAVYRRHRTVSHSKELELNYESGYSA